MFLLSRICCFCRSRNTDEDVKEDIKEDKTLDKETIYYETFSKSYLTIYFFILYSITNFPN